MFERCKNPRQERIRWGFFETKIFRSHNDQKTKKPTPKISVGFFVGARNGT
jgi:hypothetical protein